MKAASGDMTIRAAPRFAEARAAVRAATHALWPALLLFALAVARQATSDLAGDVSWLITAGEQFLDGKIAYVDFIETNPPAAIFVYLPAIMAARLIGATPELMVELFCFAGIGGAA